MEIPRLSDSRLKRIKESSVHPSHPQLPHHLIHHHHHNHHKDTPASTKLTTKTPGPTPTPPPSRPLARTSPHAAIMQVHARYSVPTPFTPFPSPGLVCPVQGRTVAGPFGVLGCRDWRCGGDQVAVQGSRDLNEIGYNIRVYRPGVESGEW